MRVAFLPTTSMPRRYSVGAEPGAQHDGVAPALRSIDGADRVGRDAIDALGDQLDVVALHRGIEVARDEDALAAEGVGGGEPGSQRGVGDLALEVAAGDLGEVVRGRIAGDEGGVLLVHLVELGPMTTCDLGIGRESHLLLVVEGHVLPRQDPRRRALVEHQVLGPLGDGRHDLDRTGTCTDDRDASTAEIVIMMPTLPSGRRFP